MQQAPSHTAILIFARTAEAEVQFKSFVAGDRSHNYRIAAGFNARILAISHQTGLPVFFIDEYQQLGNTFGERYANAFQQLFELGYERVLSVGNDCLSLKTSCLQTAAEALQQQPVVIGPDTAGGIYLLGLHRDQFHYDAFVQLPWQQSQLGAALCDQFEASAIALLPPQADVNTPSQFRKALRSFTELPQWLRQLVNRLYCPTVRSRFEACSLPKYPYRQSVESRGPPVF